MEYRAMRSLLLTKAMNSQCYAAVRGAFIQLDKGMFPRWPQGDPAVRPNGLRERQKRDGTAAVDYQQGFDEFRHRPRCVAS
jgi:hypothetical protein